MFFARKIFILAVAILLFGISVCIVESFRKKTKISFSIGLLETCAFFSILFCLLTLVVRNYVIAMIFWGLYYVFLDLSLCVLVYFILVLEGKKKISKTFRIISIVASVIIFLDILGLLTNGISKGYFEIYENYYSGGFLNWGISFKGLFLAHLLICYLLSLKIIYSLIKDTAFSNNFYKSKFILILILLVIELIWNGFFYLKSEAWQIDFSIFIYGILAIIVYIVSIFSIPNEIRKNLLSIATDLVSDGVLCFDIDKKIIYSNKQAKTIIDEGNIFWIDNYINSGKDHIVKIEKIDIDNKTHIFNVEYRTIVDKKGRYSGSFIKLDDKTEEVYNMEIQEYRASHDDLTGLYNRTQFFSEAERILHESPEIPRYFVCTNIKDFKIVNDLFGVEFGNALLIRQAEMITRANYEGVIHGRISGDKFAMLIPKENFKPEIAAKNTDEIKNFTKSINYQIKIFIGVYEIADPFENVHTMYDKANMAIKNIKDEYNTVLALYDTSLMTKLMQEKKIISDFTSALDNGEFCMFLQPQISSLTGKCVGAEALVRWYDSNGVYRHPSEFIPILEKSGLIYKLDSYIWEVAVKKLSEWKKKGIDDLYISVNISTRDFYYADLYKVFTGLVEEYDVSPENLNLEITESVIIDERNSIKNVLCKLQQYGFKIEMDDFGSGYSSLNVLKDIPMDVLKIDMEFLRQTQNQKRSNLIIASVVSMARKLGMKIITEGVEDEIHAEVLSIMGVDLFQGYLYSKPIAVYDFEHKYLEERL